MEITVETAMTVALFFAVFAGIASIGSSLVLGVGYERLRNGMEVIKKQSSFFGTAIHYLDERTEDLEKRMDEALKDDSRAKKLEEKIMRRAQAHDGADLH